MRVILTALVVLLAAAPPARALTENVTLRPGDPMPDLRFEALLSPGDYEALGLDRRAGPVAIGEIGGELLVIEFFNKSCVPCQAQVRHVERFYRALRDQGLWGRVRLLAVGAGNQLRYLPRFRKKRGLTFPISADPRFDEWSKLGRPGRTPFTVFCVRRNGNWAFGDSHFGIHDAQWLLAEARSFLDGTHPDLPPEPVPNPTPPLAAFQDPEELRTLAAAFLSRVAGIDVAAEPVDGADLPLFRAVGPRGPLDLYALARSREAVCAICHGVDFLFAFTRNGTIRGVDPVRVYKYGNAPWTEADRRAIEARLVGRSMRDLTFDEGVDAVTQATISSTLIFDAIRRAAEVLDRLPDA